MLILVIPFLVGWILVTWAQNFIMLLIGRFILGLAGGCFCISAPQYSTEIAEKEIRGILGTFFQLLITSGILFVYIVGAFVPVFWTNVICSVFPLIYGAILIFMPESPVYYMMKNREADAVKSIKWLRGAHYDPKLEIENLQSELHLNSNISKTSQLKAFSQPAATWAVVVVKNKANFKVITSFSNRNFISYSGDGYDGSSADVRYFCGTFFHDANFYCKNFNRFFDRSKKIIRFCLLDGRNKFETRLFNYYNRHSQFICYNHWFASCR